MSEEMAVGDNATSEEKKGANEDSASDAKDVAPSTESISDASAIEKDPGAAGEKTKVPENENMFEVQVDIKHEVTDVEDMDGDKKSIDMELEALAMSVKCGDDESNDVPPIEESKGIKRRASAAFSDEGDEDFKGFDNFEPSSLTNYNRLVEEDMKIKRRKSPTSEPGDDCFKGFEMTDQKNLTGYSQVVERLEAEVTEAVTSYTPIKTVIGASPSTIRPSKRPRQDTDGSRPSSAMSSRSEGDWAIATDASMSPATGRAGRRAGTEMSSPLLRVPLERGWRRELVYRATQEQHGRRNADIYYYSPAGKKLRSMREISENLSGTGLSIENFSFFKEPLGIDDPDKETIRDAKMIRRVESPVPAAPQPPVEGKRTPKPKAPKGASPEPATQKSPPAKIKVKSVGSRLSNNGTTATPKQVKKPPQPTPPPPPQQPQPPPQQPQPAPDNNNTSAWKKPRGPPPLQPRPAPPPLAPPPNTQERGQSQQPCSMSCGRGAVPSLACAACLCLYHPACVGATIVPQHAFYCKNCRKSSVSPPPSPPPLTHKSAAPRRPPPPPPAPAHASALAPAHAPLKPNANKRVLLRIKKSNTGASGSSGTTWATVAQGPQSLAILNGRRFIVVTRPMHN